MASRASALHLVTQECANYSGGHCQGAWTFSNFPEEWFCNPLPQCLLKDNLPCWYFEKCLLPLLSKKPKYRGADTDYASLCTADAAEVEHPFCRHTETYMAGTGASERFCDCGAPLGKHKRHCPDCLKSRRKGQWREEKARQRGCPTN